MTFRDDTSEMQKRVADAIFKACSGYMLRINCDAPARAAIEAMREPTVKLHSGPVPSSDGYARAIWRQMIDEALR